MKKILHLICNSHIDPVWQWDWDEGAGAALATFYAACNLLDKYDFVFCHNEVILYEYIEKYDPELFERIKKLIVEGKWKIMGGWYCQPDCFVPSGESFIRQITLGREYFWEKFGQRPTTALNFDSFGHTRGLPQILKKTGFSDKLSSGEWTAMKAALEEANKCRMISLEMLAKYKISIKMIPRKLL